MKAFISQRSYIYLNRSVFFEYRGGFNVLLKILNVVGNNIQDEFRCLIKPFNTNGLIDVRVGPE